MSKPPSAAPVWTEEMIAENNRLADEMGKKMKPVPMVGDAPDVAALIARLDKRWHDRHCPIYLHGIGRCDCTEADVEEAAAMLRRLSAPAGEDAAGSLALAKIRITELLARAAAAELLAQQRGERIAELERWLDNNTTWYDVLHGGDLDGQNTPVLAAVSKRIWYHATDDQQSYPFSKVIDAALAAQDKDAK